MKYVVITYLSWTIIISLITFILYGCDKKRAIKNKDRIKERTLLGFTSIGGSVGAFVGRIVFRHKTEKKYFSLVIFVSLLLNLLILVGFIFALRG